MKKNFKNFVVVGLIAVMFAATLPAKPVLADTRAEYISQILILIEEIKALQAELKRLIAQYTGSNTYSGYSSTGNSSSGTNSRGGSSSSNTSSSGTDPCNTNFTTNQTTGSEGAQVKALQQFLISRGYSIPGGATGYFGSQTKSAVAAFQRDANITPPEGYFGPTTRAKVRSVCGGGSINSGSSGGNNNASGGSYQSIMLNIHNQTRSKHGLDPLTWSDALARSAQAYANELSSRGCPLVHSDSDYGENLYREWTSREIVFNPAGAANWWADEEKFYNYNSNSCKAGEQCGHYTQIVWDTTKRVGCGVSTCSASGKNTQMWVCHYDPAGNIRGQRPY